MNWMGRVHRPILILFYTTFQSTDRSDMLIPLDTILPTLDLNACTARHVCSGAFTDEGEDET
jgi:hypothetical protein